MESFNLDNIALAILDDLKAHATNVVTGSSLSSPRAVGDAVQNYLGEKGLNTGSMSFRVGNVSFR